MEFSKVVKERSSVRSYDSSKKVSDGQLLELFDLVKLAPSPYNLQPWEFVVVRSREGRKFLQENTGQEHVGGCSAVVIVLGANPSGNAEEIAKDRMANGTMDAEKKTQFEKRMKELSVDKKLAKEWAAASGFLAGMTLLLAAKNMGLDTCMIGLFEAESIKKRFGIPKSYDVVILITLGYASGKLPERPMRYGFERIVHLERFGGK